MRLNEPDERITRLLFERARGVVHDGFWQVEGAGDPEQARRAREMNDAFLARGEFRTREIRMWRWAPDGSDPLLFVEAAWIDEDRRLPLFAVDAVVRYGGEPRILSFDCTKAEWMRQSEFRDRERRLGTEKAAFLNGWKLGSEYFVLTFLPGYEGYSVDLRTVDLAKGLVPILGFGN